MKPTNLYLVLIVAIVGSCSAPSEENSTVEKDKKFQQIADQYLDGHLNARPEMGTYLGLHQYDGKASDMSRVALDRELLRLKEYEGKVSAMDPDSLGAASRYDYQIL